MSISSDFLYYNSSAHRHICSLSDIYD